MRSTRVSDTETEEYYRSKLYQGVLNSPEGQKVLKDLVERICGVGQPAFAADPYRTAYNCGKQDVARAVLALCNPQLDRSKPNVIMERNNDS